MAYGLCSSYLPSGASMGKLVSAAVLGAIAFSVLLAAALLRSQRPGPIVSLLRFGGPRAGALAPPPALRPPTGLIAPGGGGGRHPVRDAGPPPPPPGRRRVPPWAPASRAPSL